ncbi:MAG: type I DNA topoisomerase [Actinomycetota bacterium]|nr:type I DNA topoisomerase [Actinomycetota bacterium]
MPRHLVIVESPAKARTIGRYLGDDFVVESSVGHIRDIPTKIGEVSEAKKDAWKASRFGIDIENGFTPMYVVTPNSKKQVSALRKAMKGADALYLATDEDREGEAIAWHLLEVLKPKVPVYRMVFHEITANAIREAVENPRELDQQVVAAQEARRVLDRLFGYEVSPVLWRKVQRGLSAGRVQSPATRIIVERERERRAFVAAEYAGVAGTFAPVGEEAAFEAKLVAVDDERVATGQDFDQAGIPREDRLVLEPAIAAELASELAGAPFTVVAVERKPYTRRPYAPFRTATLQQEAGRKLRFAARRTMSAAQRLYEGGFITYMRTDSTNLSGMALSAARSLVAGRFGEAYLPEKPRFYGKKAKGAQEAHEAIRPAGERFQDPENVARSFGARSDEARLYDLIWKRTVASQMKDAKGESLQLRLGGTAAASGRACEFSATGRTILFAGFLKAYVEDIDDPDAARDDQERHLPQLDEGQALEAVAMDSTVHETKPPARYTEASLVKRLEELGIGRPSTYASIISTIQDRGYVRKHGSALVPTLKAFAVIGLLEEYFGDYVDYDFTALMEEDLDKIAAGEEKMAPYLERFYSGSQGHPGLRDLVSDGALEAIDPRAVNSFTIGDVEDGVAIVARCGQYGPYLVRGEDRASIPEDLPMDELTIERATELLEAPSGDRTIGEDPETGLTVFAKAGRFGPYVQLGERDAESKGKPKTASLFETMSPETVTLDEALRLLTQPRIVGEHPEDGKPITAQNGRYGPYVKWGNESRSLDEEEAIFTVDVDSAVALLAQPKKRGGRKAAAPLKEFGDDPNTGEPIVLKNGRFGPYVTDGETNASLRVADSVDTITLDRAVELLADRRAKGPAPKRKKAPKKTAKKTAKKKSKGS